MVRYQGIAGDTIADTGNGVTVLPKVRLTPDMTKKVG
jgi:hypothetical protein